MKFVTGILFVGILMECLTFLVSSPLDARSITKPVKTADKTSSRSKREPGVALVLSIIDKNSPKIQKLEIDMDDNGYNIKDRNSKISSAKGKRLISQLLSNGDVKIKSEVQAEEAKKQKWEELLEIIKDATNCKHKKSQSGNKRKKHHREEEDEPLFKPQKIRRKLEDKDNSEDDKLTMILQLLEEWKNKDNSENVRKPKPDSNVDEETDKPIERETKPDHIEGDEDVEEIEEPIKRRPKPSHIDWEENSEETEAPIKRKPKPSHFDRDESSEETEAPIKRKPKPSHIDGDGSSEETEEPIKRRPKPSHIDWEENSEETEAPIKRKPKPSHFDRDESSEETEAPIKRKPKPSHIDSDGDSEEIEEPIKRRPKPTHIARDESSEETEAPIKRKPKPSHIDRDESSEETEEPVKRKPKPSHIDRDEDSEETEEPIKRRPKPSHIDRDESIEEIEERIRRRPKPSHIDIDSEETEEPIKRKPKPSHIERDDSEETEEPIKRKIKPGDSDETENPEHDEEDCEDCELDDDSIKRRGKPKHSSDINDSALEEEMLDKFGPKKVEDISTEEESTPSADDLDEEQLLQGIAFIQNQLKRFLGIDCTCNPTETTVLSECPLHKKSSARRRREDQKKSVVSVRSSVVTPKEENKKLITNKKFTKKATLKSMKEGKKYSKNIIKKSDSLAASSISKPPIYAKPEKLPTSTEDILKMLKEMGISAHLVQKKVPNTEATVKEASPSKTSTANNDDLQFFRNKSGVHRSATRSQTPDKKYRRKLRNRRKGNKSATSSGYRSTNPKPSKRTQRGITSEEITAKQEERTAVRNHETQTHKEEVILPRPVSKDVEDVVDPEIESLKNLYNKYKERVREEMSHEHTLNWSDEDDVTNVSTNKDESIGSIESGITESVEALLKQISSDDSHGYLDILSDDSSSSKEYVLTHESDGKLSNLYNKFPNTFGTSDVESEEADDGKRKFKYDDIVARTVAAHTDKDDSIADT